MVWRRRLIFVALLAILIAALSVGGNRSLVKIYQMSKTKTELGREIEQIRQRSQELAREIQAFTNDQGRVEAIAREDLGLVKPGEVVYQFGSLPDPRRGQAKPTPVPSTSPR